MPKIPRIPPMPRFVWVIAHFCAGLGIALGLFLAGAFYWPYLQPYSPWPAQKAAVPVRPVAVASVDPFAKRTSELCAVAADQVAKMREELKELKAKATAPKLMK